MCLVAQSCASLCDPMDCSPPDTSVHGDSPGNNTGVNCHAVLQRILPAQGPNPGLMHCWWILYQLSHQRSLMLGKFEDKRRGQQRMRWLDSITTSMDMNSSQLWEIVKHREALCAEVHGVAKS